jgi:transcriptional regulator with XRE-family HTH domain
MPKVESRRLLSERARQLAPKKRDGTPNVTELARRLGRGGKLNVGAAQRILSGDTSVGLDLLDLAADTFGEPPWRLIRPPAADLAPGDNELERQLLQFWRGMTPQRRDDLLLMANRWYSESAPGDGRADPFRKRSKAPR